jgi:hypothetical protein
MSKRPVFDIVEIVMISIFVICITGAFYFLWRCP